jgi:hypothetical protein
MVGLLIDYLVVILLLDLYAMLVFLMVAFDLLILALVHPILGLAVDHLCMLLLGYSDAEILNLAYPFPEIKDSASRVAH